MVFSAFLRLFLACLAYPFARSRFIFLRLGFGQGFRVDFSCSATKNSGLFEERKKEKTPERRANRIEMMVINRNSLIARNINGFVHSPLCSLNDRQNRSQKQPSKNPETNLNRFSDYLQKKAIFNNY